MPFTPIAFNLGNLKNIDYHQLKDHRQRRDFVISLLGLNKQERLDVLIAQYQLNPDSIPHLLKSLLANHPERIAVFKKYPAYDAAKQDVIRFIATVSPERLTPKMRETNLTSISTKEIISHHATFIFYERHKIFLRMFKAGSTQQQLSELDTVAKEIFIRGQLDPDYQNNNKWMTEYIRQAKKIKIKHVKKKKNQEVIKEQIINTLAEHCVSVYELLTSDLEHLDRAVTFIMVLLDKIRLQEFTVYKPDAYIAENLAAKKISLYGDIISDVTSYRYMNLFLDYLEASTIEHYIYTILIHIQRMDSLPNKKQLDCLDEVFSFARVFLIKVMSYIPADQFNPKGSFELLEKFISRNPSDYDKPQKVQSSPLMGFITQSKPQSFTSGFNLFSTSGFGIRTEAMVETLPRFVDYNGTQFRDFTIVARHVTDFVGQKLVSIGAVSGSDVINRELITLDPASPYLLDLYASLKMQLKKWQPLRNPPATRDVLEQIMLFIRAKLGTHTNEQGILKAEALINEWLIRENKEDSRLFAKTIDGVPAPVISIDEFIKKQSCLCRHHALITAHLLQKCMMDGLIREGEIHLNRDNIVRPERTSGHSWVVYKTKYNVYVVDTMWNKMPYDLERDQKKLTGWYKEFACKNMISHYLKKAEPPLMEDKAIITTYKL